MSDYVWCLHCERTYLRSNASVGWRGHAECAYSDCDGSLFADGWSWLSVRDGREDRYPLEPVAGRVYPLYDDIVGRWLKSRRNPDRCDAAGCDNHVGKGQGWVFRFDCGLEFCRECAEGSSSSITVGGGVPQRYVIGSPPPD